MVDAIALGCIPVFTNEEQRSLWPWFWGSWIYNASVLLPVDSVLSGAADLVRGLERIPAASVGRMQRVIAEHAHELQYNAVDSAALQAAAGSEERPSLPLLRDGFEIALERAWHLSRGAERQALGRQLQRRAALWAGGRRGVEAQSRGSQKSKV